MILALAVLSQYTRVTDDDDRQHLMGIAELAMQLQRSANNSSISRRFQIGKCITSRYVTSQMIFITYSLGSL